MTVSERVREAEAEAPLWGLGWPATHVGDSDPGDPRSHCPERVNSHPGSLGEAPYREPRALQEGPGRCIVGLFSFLPQWWWPAGPEVTRKCRMASSVLHLGWARLTFL